MDEKKMDNNTSENKKNMSTRKPPIRRRSTRVTKKDDDAHDHPHPHPHHQDCVVNTVEVRREIAHALNLHRSSSTSTSSSGSGTTKMASSNKVGKFCNYAAAASCSSNITNSYRSFLMEPYYLPFPQPIWSTTSPSIFPSTSSTTINTAPPPAYHHHHHYPAAMEEVNNNIDDHEFEYWRDDDLNLASSYTWWLGFLESLDNQNQTNKEEMRSSYRNVNTNINIGDSMEIEGDDYQSSSSVVLDEWLINILQPATTENSDDHHQLE